MVVCCLDGGAWDRPTLHGRFQSVEEAVRYIKSDFSPYRGQEVRQLENFRIFGVGGRSPYPACAEGAVLDIGPGGINLVLSMTKPSKAEIRAIRTGRMQIGMIMYGTIAVLLWRFHDRKGRKIAEFDSIFHIGLLPPEKRQVPFRPDGSRHQVLIVLQNERATCRALRRVSLPADVSETIDAVAAAQAAQTARPDWSPASHRAEVEAYFSDFPTPAHAFALTDSPAFMGGRDGRF